MQLWFVLPMKVSLNLSPLLILTRKAFESLPTTCKEKIPTITDNPSSGITAELAVPVANIYSIAIIWLILAVQAAKYHTSIGRTMNATTMHYGNVFLRYNIEWDTYKELNKEDHTNVPVIHDKENYHKVIKWVSDFNDCFSKLWIQRTFCLFTPRIKQCSK